MFGSLERIGIRETSDGWYSREDRYKGNLR